MLFPFLLVGSAATTSRPEFLQSFRQLSTVPGTQWIPRSLQVAADGSTVGALSFTSDPFATVSWTTTSGTNDIVVAKWDASGVRQWATYFVPTDTSTAANVLTSLTLDATGVYVTLTIRRPVWVEGATANYTLVTGPQDILGTVKLDLTTGLALWGSSQLVENIREGVFAWSTVGSLVLIGRKSGIVQYPVDTAAGTLNSMGTITNAVTSRLWGAVIDRTDQVIVAYTANSNGYLYLASASVGAFSGTELRILLVVSTWTSVALSLSSQTSVAVTVTATANQFFYPNSGTSTFGTQISAPVYSPSSVLVFVVDRTFGTFGQVVDLRRYPRSSSSASVQAVAVETAADGTLWVAGRYNFATGGGVLELGGVNITETDSAAYSFVAQVDPVSTTCRNVAGTWTCSTPPDVVNVETFPATLYALTFKSNNSRVLGLGTWSPAQIATFTAAANSTYLATTYTACKRSQFEQVAPSQASDRTCAAISVCTASQYQSAPPSAKSDRQCRDISSCTTGTFLTTPATTTSDNICAPWKTCPTGFTVFRVGTNISDVSCAAMTCTDGVRNAAESDVDCGGTQCPGCRNGQRCTLTSDCAAGAYCNFGTCYANQCYDGLLNGEETDVTFAGGCGGSLCAGCPFGYRCNINQDCAPNYWCGLVNGTKRCIPPCTHTAILALGDGIAGTNGACSATTPSPLPLLPGPQWTLTDVMNAYNISANSPNCQVGCKDALSTALGVCNGVVRGTFLPNGLRNQGIEGFILALQQAQTKCGGTIYPPGDKTPKELEKTPTPRSGAIHLAVGVATMLGLFVL